MSDQQNNKPTKILFDILLLQLPPPHLLTPPSPPSHRLMKIANRSQIHDQRPQISWEFSKIGTAELKEMMVEEGLLYSFHVKLDK